MNVYIHKTMATESSKFGAKLFCEILNKFLHDSVNLLVIQCFLLILQNKIDGIALFAFLQILTFVNIKELNALQ